MSFKTSVRESFGHSVPRTFSSIFFSTEVFVNGLLLVFVSESGFCCAIQAGFEHDETLKTHNSPVSALGLLSCKRMPQCLAL